MLIGVLIISSSGFIRRAVLFPVHMQQGLSFDQARDELDKLKLNGGKTFVSTSMFTLFDSMNNLTDNMKDTSVNYILIQQNFTGDQPLPSIQNFRLVHSYFINNPVYFNSIKIANSVPGYQFALYEKD
jgi:hypothetical protein